jgi:DNA-binding NarL/FixJ family response regulator
MRCEEAAEFVSALCDGESIPPVAAEHIGACETCQARLREYGLIRTELRRLASLEPLAEATATWEAKQRTTSSWWAKGWALLALLFKKSLDEPPFDPGEVSPSGHRFIASNVTLDAAPGTQRRDPVLPTTAADTMPELSVVIIATDSEQCAVLRALVDGTGVALTVLTCANYPVAPSDRMMLEIRAANPNVTLVDIPSDNAMSAQRAIELLHQEMPDAAIFAIGNLNQPQTVVNAMRAGAREFIERPTNTMDLLEAFVRLTTPQQPRGRREGIRGKARLRSFERTDYQQVIADLHRKILDRLDLEELGKASDDAARDAALVVIRNAVNSEVVPLSFAERERLSREILDEVFGPSRIKDPRSADPPFPPR